MLNIGAPNMIAPGRLQWQFPQRTDIIPMYDVIRFDFYRMVQLWLYIGNAEQKRENHSTVSVYNIISYIIG